MGDKTHIAEPDRGHIQYNKKPWKVDWQELKAEQQMWLQVHEKFLHIKVYQAPPQEQNATGQFEGPHADGDGERDPYESGL